MYGYIPMFTDEYKMAFCQATSTLPTDIQKIIWEKNKEIDFYPLTPPAPMKKRTRTDSNSSKRILFV